MPPVTASAAKVWLTEADCNLEEFRALVEQATDADAYPAAAAVQSNVVMYEARSLLARAEGERQRLEVQAELARALSGGPGIVAVKGAFDSAVVDRVSEVFMALMEEEAAAGHSRGDHFAKPGTNQRLWNSLSKLVLRAPDVAADYLGNLVVDLVSVAWLGPGYQLTSQVNLVNPGGVAQSVHRDYHLGFMTNEQAAAFPVHAHQLSPVLTLQAAVAHCDMPLESGPTFYLPHSQKYVPGYLAWRLPDFARYAEEHYVQLPLEKGDAVFFNPALFHAAGNNRSAATRRMANLLQISSAFGRAMESIDRGSVTAAIYPVLLERKRAGAGHAWLRAAIAACAEGYSFPTNLDLDAPVGGLAPPTPAQLTWEALQDEVPPDAFREQLAAAAQRKSA